MIVEVTRGGVVESRHEIAAVAVTSKGQLKFGHGETTLPVFPRSALKPLQALTVVASGAADNLGDDQLALMCASHHGEEQHVSRVLHWLARMGLSPDDLACGPDWPRQPDDRDTYLLAGGKAGSALYNCSGKHCGQLCYCQHNNWPTAGYHEPDHPAQTSFRAMLADLADGAETALGIDGCNLPAPQLPLDRFALALARMADADTLQPHQQQPARRILSAFMAHPELTGGRRAPNSMLTHRGLGRFASKNGAEGVYGVIVPELKLGIAVKCLDGTMRAADLATAEILRQLALIEDADIHALGLREVRNSRDIIVGEIRCRF